MVRAHPISLCSPWSLGACTEGKTDSAKATELDTARGPACMKFMILVDHNCHMFCTV